MSDDIQSDRNDLMEHLRTQGNRSYRRFHLITIAGCWVLERDPICWMFDEVMNEMCGTEPDLDDRRQIFLD